VRLADNFESGSISFFLQNSFGELRSLAAKPLEEGEFSLVDGNTEVGRMMLISGNAPRPIIANLSNRDKMMKGLGLMLNQNRLNSTAGKEAGPWQVSLTMDLYREASYSNEIGLILFDLASEGVIDPLTGIPIGSLSPNWYLDAERHAIWKGTTDNLVSHNFNVEFSFNSLVELDSVALVPYIKTPIADDTAYYSSFDGLNSDNASHIIKLSRNTFGFEDKSGLGDADHDDMILVINNLTVF
jgi:hypothetical protein